MVAAEESQVANDFKKFCDMAYNGETVVISTQEKRNVVMIQESLYNEIMKFKRNEEYQKRIAESFKQLEEGEIITKTMSELRAMEK